MKPRTIRRMPQTEADKRATRTAQERAYNAKYYREVRGPKLRAVRRQHVAGEVIDWFLAKLDAKGAMYYTDELIAAARKRFVR